MTVASAESWRATGNGIYLRRRRCVTSDVIFRGKSPGTDSVLGLSYTRGESCVGVVQLCDCSAPPCDPQQLFTTPKGKRGDAEAFSRGDVPVDFTPLPRSHWNPGSFDDVITAIPQEWEEIFFDKFMPGKIALHLRSKSKSRFLLSATVYFYNSPFK